MQRNPNAAGSNLYADSLANLLAVELLRAFSSQRLFPERRAANGLPNKKLARVLELIHGDLAADFSLAMLAQAAGLSEYYFLRLFKQSTGVTPHQYVLRQRIERAKDLLRAGELGITEIAFSLGFANPAHFAHYFRRHTGFTPSEMRQNF